MNKIVEVQNVTKVYGKNNEKKTQALSGIRGVRMFFWTFFSNYIPVSSDIEEDLVLLKIT